MKFGSMLKKVSLFLVIVCFIFCFFSCYKNVNENDYSQGAEDTKESLILNIETQKKTESDTVLTREEVFEKVKPSIVKVLACDYDGKTVISQGSGFFIDDKGTFITNAHVIKGCYHIKAQTYSEEVFEVDAILKYNDLTSDYAICRIKGMYSSSPVEFTDSVKSGDIVYALGYPKDAFSISTTSGRIISTNAVMGEKQYYLENK